MTAPANPRDLPPEEDDVFDAPDATTEAEAEPCDTGAEAPETPESVKRGVDVIKKHWRHAPNGPGVYRMIAESGEVLYVGKAKNVRKRVASYTRLAGHVNRIARMISATTTMVFISVETETDALLLEANLIKQMKPRFNVLMRD
ncbi:MAG: GIY-YIG nuclease family protein, partial [Methylocystis silviterrae]|uniref:GIY-YIG nuclease family protein n=1 Tax=Methylocystis silviterrae TaxID=2743612 RepID=UPI003C788995